MDSRLRSIPTVPSSVPPSETKTRPRSPASDPDAEALLIVAKVMGRARVAKGVAKIAMGMLAGAAQRAAADFAGGRSAHVLRVARAAAGAAAQVAANRVRPPPEPSNDTDVEDAADDARESCVDIA